MRKLLRIFAVFLICFACLIGIGLYALDSLFSGMCGNETFNEAISSDGGLKAVVFQRDCGATTGFSTQISLIAPMDKLENDGGNIFIVDGHPNERKIEMVWINPKRLLIKNTSGLYPHKKEQKFKDVQIDYE